MATRINKYLSEVGYCSRREADRLIQEGKVTVNSKIPGMGTKVEEGESIAMFEDPEVKPLIEGAGHIYDSTVISSYF